MSLEAPIDDLTGTKHQYSDKEVEIRKNLAALYRLVDKRLWNEGIYQHMSARLDDKYFFFPPLGTLYSEITAASLLKFDMDGRMVDSVNGSVKTVNNLGMNTHRDVYCKRPDITCVIHLHVRSVAAVSVMKCGLLPLSQEAIQVGKVSYHKYDGIIEKNQQRENFLAHLQPGSKVMILENHGIAVFGDTIEDAYNRLEFTVAACEVQVKAISAGIENLILIPDSAAAQVASRERGVVAKAGFGMIKGKKDDWKAGELEWEAWMQWLDRKGCRTGYQYKS